MLDDGYSDVIQVRALRARSKAGIHTTSTSAILRDASETPLLRMTMQTASRPLMTVPAFAAGRQD